MAEVPKGVVDRHNWLVVDEVDRLGANLTQWEIDYVESLKQQLLAGKSLTDAQVRRLDQVHEERMP